eukprot:gene23405-31747_t
MLPSIDPPVVNNIVEHAVCNGDIADATLVDLEVSEHQVVQRVVGAEVAPMWFQAAMVNINEQLGAMQDAMHAMQASLAIIRQDIINGPIKRQNFNATANKSPIYPLEVNGHVPASFPHNRKDLFTLPAATINPILVFYTLADEGNVQVKRRRLASFIGIREQ